MEEEALCLKTLPPPPDGWSRLTTRRDRQRGPDRPWVAAGLGAAACLLSFWFSLQSGSPGLQLGAAGARLVGESSGGTGLHLLQSGEVQSLPSDSGTQLFWVRPATGDP